MYLPIRSVNYKLTSVVTTKIAFVSVVGTYIIIIYNIRVYSIHKYSVYYNLFTNLYNISVKNADF